MINEIEIDFDIGEGNTYDVEAEQDIYSAETDQAIIIRQTDFVLRPATTSTLGGVIVGQDLKITEEGVLSVDKATSVEEDNTRPITAAAVYTEVGNINALLQTI